MKFLGRIILIIVGAILIANGIWGIIAVVNEGLFGPVGQWVNGSWLSATASSFIGSILYIIGGLVALLAGIRGRRSLLLIIIAIVLFVIAIITFVSLFTSNSWTNVSIVATTIIALLLPIGYFVGTFLLKRK